MKRSIAADGADRALDVLRECATADGFLASSTNRDNYRRVWSRDGCIMSIAALQTDDENLRHTALATLRTLLLHQGPHGEIPSNVDAPSGRVSYGGTAGRVDGNLWFLIACGAYAGRTGDMRFIEEFFPAMERVRFLLGAWEFNMRGLLYVPHTGDWSDEYIQHGYILYDQLLYYRALQELCALGEQLHGRKDHQLCGKIGRLRDLLRANYWLTERDDDDPFVYHPVLFEKGRQAAAHADRHWMAFFSPAGYGYRFDALANVLVSLFDIADDAQRDAVDAFIAGEVVQEDVMLLPAFHPVIEPADDAWRGLQVSFSHTFKNRPYEFHNGGLWPLVTGFAVLDLAKRGKRDLAARYLDGIHRANALDAGGDGWGFYEFLNGGTHEPGGTRRQGWSAAAAIIGAAALNGSYAL